MKKILAVLAVIFVLCAAGTALAADTIKIGYLAALTGDYAQYGLTEVNMAKMVVADFNAKGGILGRKIELIPYDTKTRNEDAVNAVRRMIDSDKVCVIVGANSSGINIATAPIVDKGKVPQISTVGTNPFVTVDNKNKVRPYSFRMCFTDPYQGELAAELAFKDLKLKKAAILYNVGSDYAQGLREYFTKSYTKLGGKIVADEGFRDTDVDFRAQLTKFKDSGAQLMFLPGMGFPAVHFDDTHIKMMLAKGVSIEDARDYCLMGCVEPQKSGRLYQWTSTAYTQWPICIELVLNHGVPLWYGKQVCPDSGDLSQFDTYEKFEASVKEQIRYITKWSSVATVISQRVHRDFAPKPLMSIMYEGCMEHGCDVASGGAMYNFGPGVVWSGLATYVDSMAAIKKLVYEDKKYTLEYLNEALKADFKGYDAVLADCLAAPKYGNDDDYADNIAADLVSFTEQEHRKYRTLYSILSHGTLSISNNTPFGQLLGASANGRSA